MLRSKTIFPLVSVLSNPGCVRVFCFTPKQKRKFIHLKPKYKIHAWWHNASPEKEPTAITFTLKDLQCETKLYT
jgi:hypothetical protein